MRLGFLGAALSVFLLPLLVPVSGCSSETDPRSSDGELIGGTGIADGVLPSTLLIKDGCTAAKVGERLILTAAHCVWEEVDIRAKYRPGAPIEISAAAAGDAAPFQRLTVRRTSVHPEWAEKCSADEFHCMRANGDESKRASDAALVETNEPIPNVPVAFVDVEPLQPGEAVILTGYGCQGSVGESWFLGRQLKAGVAQLLPQSALLHPGSGVKPETARIVTDHDLLTPGPAYATPGAGLCPGDSGGPLYRVKGGGATVVGINGSYTFSGPRAGLPVTNWHTRLDWSAPSNVGDWLASLGASTCEGSTCPTRTLVAPLNFPPPAPGAEAGLVTDGRDAQCQRDILDTTLETAAVKELLGVDAYCLTFNGQRVALEDGTYVYGANVICAYVGAPSQAAIDAFPAAMEARGFFGFHLSAANRNMAIGSSYSARCSQYPTTAEVCRATLPTDATASTHVTSALRVSATCTSQAPEYYAAPQDEVEVWVAPVSCSLASTPTPSAAAALTETLSNLGTYYMTYDAATNTVTGALLSWPCNAL